MFVSKGLDGLSAWELTSCPKHTHSAPVELATLFPLICVCVYVCMHACMHAREEFLLNSISALTLEIGYISHIFF